LNPCWNGAVSSWCCNDYYQSQPSCCINNSGPFTFNLTSLDISNKPTGITAISCPTTKSAAGIAATCPVDKSTVIGSSVGAFLAGTLIAGLLGLYLGLRQPKKQVQEAVPNTTFDQRPMTDWHAELPTASPGVMGPEQLGAGIAKYEIDGRQVSSSK
jgi:hypothetical protein